MFLRLAPFFLVAHASTRRAHIALVRRSTSECTGTISSLSDVANAVKCKAINIKGFTVSKTFDLALIDGTTVNLLGDIAFGNKSWTGPLFRISGNYINWNGNGHTFNGGGPFYWDGLGSNGGVTKPRPMMKIAMSGVFKNTKVYNSPAHTFSVSSKTAPLKISGITIDNSLGDLPNGNSGGKPAGHNTDGFDISSINLIIENSIVKNQDDCMIVNSGNNVILRNNHCSGGHGISIGGGNTKTVTNVLIQNNVVVDNDQALRIKTAADSSGPTVSNITYTGNTGTGLRRFGVLIDQSYPDTMGTPGSGVVIKDIKFVGATNTLSVVPKATPVAVNCGKGTCTGAWDWTSLKASGGKANVLLNAPNIKGLSY
ncbi:endo-polygalacturonase PG1 [Hysterangium stoloniferum]|nr:endo-polygalacturonase PG1 [Hysterangium stoloniferum]